MTMRDGDLEELVDAVKALRAAVVEQTEVIKNKHQYMSQRNATGLMLTSRMTTHVATSNAFSMSYTMWTQMARCLVVTSSNTSVIARIQKFKT